VTALARAWAPTALALVLTLTATALSGLLVVAHGVAIALIWLVSLAVHELGHIAVYRLFSRDGVARFSCRLLRPTLSRERLPRRADRTVTAAGPLAPILLVCLIAPTWPMFPAETAAAAIIATSHALFLVIPSADRAAWRAW
jgi:hypothetical protein